VRYTFWGAFEPKVAGHVNNLPTTFDGTIRGDDPPFSPCLGRSVTNSGLPSFSLKSLTKSAGISWVELDCLDLF